MGEMSQSVKVLMKVLTKALGPEFKSLAPIGTV